MKEEYPHSVSAPRGEFLHAGGGCGPRSVQFVEDVGSPPPEGGGALRSLPRVSAFGTHVPNTALDNLSAHPAKIEQGHNASADVSGLALLRQKTYFPSPAAHRRRLTVDARGIGSRSPSEAQFFYLHESSQAADLGFDRDGRPWDDNPFDELSAVLSEGIGVIFDPVHAEVLAARGELAQEKQNLLRVLASGGNNYSDRQMREENSRKDSRLVANQAQPSDGINAADPHPHPRSPVTAEVVDQQGPRKSSLHDDGLRFTCPHPGCSRRFRELWRLRVHHRASPLVRGSGKERGHGVELPFCPKCLAPITEGKRHMNCPAASARHRATAGSAARRGEAGVEASAAWQQKRRLPKLQVDLGIAAGSTVTTTSNVSDASSCDDAGGAGDDMLMARRESCQSDSDVVFDGTFSHFRHT